MTREPQYPSRGIAPVWRSWPKTTIHGSRSGEKPSGSNHQQCTWPHRLRQQRRQCSRPQRSRQQRRHDTSDKMPRSTVYPGDTGAIGAACAVPDTAAKTKPATAIANTVRNILSLLFASLVAHGWIRFLSYRHTKKIHGTHSRIETSKKFIVQK